MAKYICILFSIFLFSCQKISTPEPKPNFRSIQSSVARLDGMAISLFPISKGVDLVQASGVVIYKTDDKVYILTAAHFFERSNLSIIREVMVSIIAGYDYTSGECLYENYVADLITESKGKDLAIVTIPVRKGTNYSVAKIFNGPTGDLLGQRVFASGTPRGVESILTEGIVSKIGKRQLNDWQSENLYIYSDAEISPGSSGGGLFNSRGELIGMLTNGILEPDLGLFISHTEIIAFLKSQGIPYIK